MHRGLIVVFAALVALSAFLGWRLAAAHETIGGNDETIAAKEVEISRANSQLVAVNLMARLTDSFQAGLQQKQTAIMTAKTARAAHVQKVIDENPDVAKWAGTPLPADIMRLHNHPTLTGADAYLKHLSESDALHTTGQ